MAHRLSCSMTCGIFLDQGSNPCLLHWQADSLPLSHQGSSQGSFFFLIVLLYSVELVSAVQQSESAIYIHLSSLFWISCPFRSPESIEFPVLYSWFSLVIYFIRSLNSIYMSISTSQFLPPGPFPLGVCIFVLHICVSTSALQIGSCVPFFRFHIHKLIYDICFFLSDLLHLV